MKSASLLLLVGAAVGMAAGGSLPTFIKPCKRGPTLNKCSIVNGNAAIPEFVKGDPKLKTQSLEPLLVSELSVSENRARGFALNVTFRDMKIKNLSTGKIVSSNIELDKLRANWIIEVPLIVIDSKYTIDGKVLVLPIQGSGPCHLELERVRLNLGVNYRIKKVKGLDYFTIVKPELTFSTENMKIRMDNLFNGDKVLGDNMNVVLNDNWRDLSDQMGPGIAKAVSLAVLPVVNKIFALVPYDQLFLN